MPFPHLGFFHFWILSAFPSHVFTISRSMCFSVSLTPFGLFFQFFRMMFLSGFLLDELEFFGMQFVPTRAFLILATLVLEDFISVQRTPPSGTSQFPFSSFFRCQGLLRSASDIRGPCQISFVGFLSQFFFVFFVITLVSCFDLLDVLLTISFLSSVDANFVFLIVKP